MTNEELWLTARLAQQFKRLIHRYCSQKKGRGDDIFAEPGPQSEYETAAKNYPWIGRQKPARNLEAIAASVAEGRIKALVVLGEDPTEIWNYRRATEEAALLHHHEYFAQWPPLPHRLLRSFRPPHTPKKRGSIDQWSAAVCND